MSVQTQREPEELDEARQVTGRRRCRLRNYQAQGLLFRAAGYRESMPGFLSWADLRMPLFDTVSRVNV